MEIQYLPQAAIMTEIQKKTIEITIFIYELRILG